MQARELEVRGAYAFTPDVHSDERGMFLSPMEATAFTEAVGHRPFAVAQFSHSVSHRGVVRGIHYAATPPGLAQYVYCPRGRVLDFVVDVRVGSPTFGRWDSTVLDAAGGRATYLPVGVGHAMVALEDDTVLTYLLSESYAPEREFFLSPLDPGLGLPLPADRAPVLSDRDRHAPTLSAAARRGLLPDYAACLKSEALL